ncbi:MAG: molecular chaperone DnaK, partial [Dolichospermum sp.]
IDQAYADLQDALYELNREVRQYYAEDEDEDLFGAIREIFVGEKEKEPERDVYRDNYRQRDSSNRGVNRDYGRENQNRSPNYETRPTRSKRPSYQDNWDDDDDWL